MISAKGASVGWVQKKTQHSLKTCTHFTCCVWASSPNGKQHTSSPPLSLSLSLSFTLSHAFLQAYPTQLCACVRAFAPNPFLHSYPLSLLSLSFPSLPFLSFPSFPLLPSLVPGSLVCGARDEAPLPERLRHPLQHALIGCIELRLIHLELEQRAQALHPRRYPPLQSISIQPHILQKKKNEMKRKGEERRGKERKGKERRGEERKEKERRGEGRKRGKEGRKEGSVMRVSANA